MVFKITKWPTCVYMIKNITQTVVIYFNQATKAEDRIVAMILCLVLVQGEAILRACEPRASSHEPRASFCEPQKIPAKKSKKGHNTLIWYLLHVVLIITATCRVNPRPREIKMMVSFSPFIYIYHILKLTTAFS